MPNNGYGLFLGETILYLQIHLVIFKQLETEKQIDTLQQRKIDDKIEEKDEGKVFSLTLSAETYSFIAFVGWQLRTEYLDLSSRVRRRL